MYATITAWKEATAYKIITPIQVWYSWGPLHVSTKARSEPIKVLIPADAEIRDDALMNSTYLYVRGTSGMEIPHSFSMALARGLIHYAEAVL